jgi:hypothetical protein
LTAEVCVIKLINRLSTDAQDRDEQEARRDSGLNFLKVAGRHLVPVALDGDG